MSAYDNDALCITFCDQGENHIGNQKIGSLAPTGFTYKELFDINTNLKAYGVVSELYNLGAYLPDGYGSCDAGLLVIRSGINIFVGEARIWSELRSLKYDSKALMYGTVRNKKARHNLCFGPSDQEANYEIGNGTVVSFDRVPCLNHVRTYLPNLVGVKANSLVAEANYYYDVDTCGIGYHGDAERKIVIALRLGKKYPLCYYWYCESKRISTRIDIDLNPGDIYIMDEKTCGYDYKKRKIPTLRHAAGCSKYID